MFQCDVCGSVKSRQQLVSEIFEVDGRRVLVENIPAQVCTHCGEPTFSRETVETVRRMLHGEAEPVGIIELEVFAYA